MRVRVTEELQLNGATYVEGQVVESVAIPEAVLTTWVDRGQAERLPEEGEPEPAPAPPEAPVNVPVSGGESDPVDEPSGEGE